jgi:glucokinase
MADDPRRPAAASGAEEGGAGSSLHLGIDLGATNLKWAVVERAPGPRSGEEDDAAWATLDRGQIPTRAGEGPDAVIGRLVEIGRAALARRPGIASLGIGVPGLYDPATGATRFLVNVPGDWAGRPVAAPVSAALGLPVVLVNDARAFGLAELRLGAGRGARSMVGLTLGTGVGGVIAIDGRVHQGHDGTAGEVGHQTIDPDGPWCNCGNRGCLEAYARADQIAHACGTASPEEAVRAAQAGDERALDGLRQIGRYLGIGIANLVTLITPDRVVLGGGVAQAGAFLFEPIRAELRRRVTTTDLDQVALVPAELGTWAGAIGAAIHGAERTALGRRDGARRQGDG